MFPPDPGKGWREEQQEIIQVFFLGGGGKTDGRTPTWKREGETPPQNGRLFFFPSQSINQII